MLRREHLGAIERAVGHDRCLHPFRSEGFERELRHFARAKHHRSSALQRTKNLLRQLHRSRAHAHCAMAQPRLTANTTAGE